MSTDEQRQLQRSCVLLLHEDHSGTAALPELESRLGASLAVRHALGELQGAGVLIYQNGGVILAPAVKHLDTLDLIAA